MIFEDTPIQGLKVITYNELYDERGFFLKIQNYALFENAGLNPKVEEIYLSQSSQNVIRGLHYQEPPFAHSKLMFCLSGSVFDVAVDLRMESPTYGHHFSINLKANSPTGLYIPEGFAHGFQALEDNTVTINALSTGYSPEYEAGIAWNSCDIDWPLDNPILSEKDKNQAALIDISSGF
ncbi:dTDP-4-dehydrorhamnose 3,5-epimerase [Gammaproteobacteria bacterium]|jgi:dTDP-4-dehydrorhamnose 3,5-epimerase|nr:dTDP-4-dehydrorhamnose 3,5-epimerase [Gammaproteobacteria bacterium]